MKQTKSKTKEKCFNANISTRKPFKIFPLKTTLSL